MWLSTTRTHDLSRGQGQEVTRQGHELLTSRQINKRQLIGPTRWRHVAIHIFFWGSAQLRPAVELTALPQTP